jgi:hypothetical protein
MKGSVCNCLCLSSSSGDLLLDFLIRILYIFLVIPRMNVTGLTKPMYQKIWELSSAEVLSNESFSSVKCYTV